MKLFKRLILLLVLCLLCVGPASAQQLSFALQTVFGEMTISVVTLEDEDTGEEANWLFLPSFANMETLFPQREMAEDGVWLVEDETGETLHVMQSQNLRALFLFSDDPENEGRDFIENCERHVNETTGRMALIGTDGRVDHADDLRQLRGRGNSTWYNVKKPYQFKLENRADLLNTGDRDEMNRTWVLLAEAWDQTLLHNKIALDLALELGMEEASHSEHVDLYYDGEYRGVYLLAEKVEIGTGRVDERDYGKLIEAWNEKIGQYDLDSLPAAQGQNRFGCEIHYVQSLAETNDPSAGAYLLEMEWAGTRSDRSWFKLGDGSIMGVKNPDSASERMVAYVSEKLEEARLALAAGEPMEKYFDVDSFVRASLLYELSYSDSGFHYSSSYFVLPAGESVFRAGPVWDFDLTWRYYRNGVNDHGVGIKDASGWMTEFYEDETFFAQFQQVYGEELYPLIMDVLLGGGEGKHLRSLDAYAEHIEAAAAMNDRIWPQQQYIRGIYAPDWHGEIELLRDFIAERSAWLHSVTVENSEHASFSVRARHAHVEDELVFQPLPWSSAQVESYSHMEVSEADEENYAVWYAEAFVKDAPTDGVCINGTLLQGERQDDGTLRIAFTFEDPSYRPVDYYGDDIGLVYDYDTYVQNYPWVLEEVGDDPEAVMEYFCDEGMYEGHVANAFFDPSWILLSNPNLADLFGEDWQLYYWEFLAYGRDDGWLYAAEDHFRPEVQDAL